MPHRFTREQAEGLAAGYAGKPPKEGASEDYMRTFEIGKEMRRGQADALAGRLPDGAQSEWWEIGYQGGLKGQ